MQTKKLPARQEIPAEYKWRLEDIYAGDELWEQDFQKALQMAGEVEAYRGRLGESARTLLQALQARESLSELSEKVYTYARMRRDENNTNPTYQAYTDRAESLSARVQTAVSFFVPEILQIPTETLEHFRREEPGLELYRFALEDIFRHKPHTLSAREEQIMAQAEEVTLAAANIFRMLNNADFTFPPIKNEEGREVEVTHGRYIRLMESRDRRVRRDAFQSMYSTYRKFNNTLAATLGANVKKDTFYARVRKHPSALQAALFADNIPPEVYDNLIQTVRRNLQAMYRYVSLRKKLLGLDELHMYDLYTPVVENVRWAIPYPEAVETVKRGLAPLGGEYLETMSRGLAEGWVDVYENKGKTSGAYSWGPYGVHPYILMNYHDNLNNVFTLAHEMGHAMHSYFSFREQPYIYAHYTIFTAEVASTVNESLLMDHLLNTVTDRDKKLYLLNHYLEQFRGTVFRQTMFAEFEKIIHEKVESGEALTADLLCQIYRRLNVDYYGPEMVVDEEVDMEWARIPHFYTAFYVYKYATGFSAAAALTRQMLKEGAPAVERYLAFLKKGGSDYPLNLLKTAGVDMATPQPVQEGLDVFARLVDEMEELALKR
ncbi:oligoendopeptidase F [Desulfoscipio geothermicus]|uniref:Oligopeptidase F n=1 Tax=Desulfoscipio geothermicus DSM 3669 TaxID=1121426 RepID=A0A1I6E9R4_9FIRM|nr:oligoendopeptidase F [Desulfoscipio geothermicus]SFR14474.1 oligoendopeptidase F [Desulfoscipio geothermicus DSM 3669]